MCTPPPDVMHLSASVGMPQFGNAFIYLYQRLGGSSRWSFGSCVGLRHYLAPCLAFEGWESGQQCNKAVASDAQPH
eukprot:1960381-Pyramimonas_sp.AAC.2